MSTVRSPLKWIGGKFASAEHILSHFPAPTRYSTYIEPCGGAAHVFMRKPRFDHREVYNDLNDDLVNWWLHVRDHREELAERLRSLPYARALYYTYHTSLFDGSTLEPLERAVRFFYVLRATGTGHLRPSPGGWNYLAESASAYAHLLETSLQEVSARFQQVRVSNYHIERVLELFDSPSTLWYIDPPYLGTDTYYTYQQGRGVYRHLPFDHQRLATMLNQLQGFVALSSYPHEHLDAWYPPDRWRTTAWQQPKHAHIAPSTGEKEPATELLLCNYQQEPEQATMASLWE